MSTVSIKKATLINAVSKYGKVLMNLVFTAVLSRLLSPNDYGVVAIVTVFTSFFNILADMGLGSAVVQNKELTDDEVNDIFSYSCYQGIMLAVFFCILSVPISFFYKNKVYLSICSILSVSVLFNTLNMIPNAVLMKNKKYYFYACNGRSNNFTRFYRIQVLCTCSSVSNFSIYSVFMEYEKR